ncbi:MAG TPA: NAD(P)H-hydrate dehydratase [Candidatus Saccharimonadales bacterium]|nr:NAD(P)H-hydrate dehydratase [Candidatus Saccharimonadales bacterium]
MDLSLFNKILFRKADSHKYDYGHVLIIGGSSGMRGAQILSAIAALRSGAGLVTIALDTSSDSHSLLTPPEIMTLPLPKNPQTAADSIADFISVRKVSAVVIGPGMKPDPQSRLIFDHLIGSCLVPMVVDGGALSLLATNLTVLNATKKIILTPHEGEFKRLVGTDLPSQRNEINKIAANFASINKVTLVLKGRRTYINQQGKAACRNDTGNPGMATAGSGDVLSGIIGSFLAQGLKPYEAAQAAVYIHGLAGDLATEQLTQPFLIASDIITHLTSAFKQIATQQKPGTKA